MPRAGVGSTYYTLPNNLWGLCRSALTTVVDSEVDSAMNIKFFSYATYTNKLKRKREAKKRGNETVPLQMKQSS
jgi:hypothetical protein